MMAAEEAGRQIGSDLQLVGIEITRGRARAPSVVLRRNAVRGGRQARGFTGNFRFVCAAKDADRYKVQARAVHGGALDRYKNEGLWCSAAKLTWEIGKIHSGVWAERIWWYSCTQQRSLVV
jgi:hypothetical protein